MCVCVYVCVCVISLCVCVCMCVCVWENTYFNIKVLIHAKHALIYRVRYELPTLYVTWVFSTKIV